MSARRIIVIGASAGGLSAMRDLFRTLDPQLQAAVFVVRHFPATSESLLPDILRRCTSLPVDHARNAEPIRRGHVSIAPAGYHMTLEKDAVRLTFGPRINNARPAIDPLFFSAARVFDGRVAGVLLSGHLDDGVAGLLAIRRAGGLTLVQDPQEAEVAEMPQSAIRYSTPHEVRPAASIGTSLSRFASGEEARRRGAPMQDTTSHDTTRGNGQTEAASGPANMQISAGVDISFSCPECGGALRRVQNPGPPQFECHIGHALTGDSLLSGQLLALERSIWFTSRTLKEITLLASELAERARDENRLHAASTFEKQARGAERHLARLQEDLLREPVDVTSSP